MKPPKRAVLIAIREILREKEQYSLQDVVKYLAARYIHTTRSEVAQTIVDIIRENKNKYG